MASDSLSGIHVSGGLPFGYKVTSGDPQPVVDAPTVQEKISADSRAEIAGLLLTTPSAVKQLRTMCSEVNFSNFEFPAARTKTCRIAILASLQHAYKQHPAGQRGICLLETLLSENYQTYLPFSACGNGIFSYSVYVPEAIPIVDIVGVGLNATDTIIRLPHFPAFNSKVEFHESEVLPGGQVASAVFACSKWGLRTRYVGKVGDDSSALLQKSVMESADVEAHWIVTPGCQSQSSYILVDEATGERTVLWKRDPRLELLPQEILKDWVVRSRLLHVDGHDCAAAAAAARLAREVKIPVTADLDNLYPQVEALLENVDYAITSRELPARVCGAPDLFVSLPRMAVRFGCRLTAATLGADGVLAWDGARFHYSPAFDVRPLDTTGAGDIFHAAFAYALLRGDGLPKILEFSCAAAGLSCLGLGARGGIAPLEEIDGFVRSGRRRPAAFSKQELEAAGSAR
jgi:sulfofructose kinase